MLPSGPAGSTLMTFVAVHESPVGPILEVWPPPGCVRDALDGGHQSCRGHHQGNKVKPLNRSALPRARARYILCFFMAVFVIDLSAIRPLGSA